jgi:hypothetical protein
MQVQDYLTLTAFQMQVKRSLYGINYCNNVKITVLYA